MNPVTQTPDDLPDTPLVHAAGQLVLVYAVFAGSWIFLSDQLVVWLVSDPAQILRASIFKGWLFVAATSLLLYGLIRRLLRQIRAASKREQAAQAENQRSQQLLTALIDSSSDAIFAKDLAGRYLLFNHETTRVTGTTAEQALGHDDTALFPPQQAEMIRANDRRVLDLNRSTSFEETLQTVEGERVFLATKGPLRDANAQVIGLFGISRDITERKRDEAALLASERQYRSLFDNSLDAILLTTPDGQILSANPQACRLFGRDEQALCQIGRGGVIDLTDPRLPAAMAERQASGRFQGELTFLDNNGKRFPGELLSKLFEGQDGQTLTCMIVRDITECKAQQQQLQLAAQVFAQGREGVTVTDAQGHIIMVNRAFTEITGYTEAEALGQNPRILKSGRQGPDFYLALWAALTTTGHWAGEVWNRRKDGTVYPQWLAISALRDSQDQTTHYVASFTDLSSTMAAENRIQWLSHFDPITGLPNRTLLQNRTEQSIAMVQRASEPLTMLMASIDHFGTINDTLGHQVGDALLNEMAKRLSGLVRDQDTVAHLSGKEFVVVLPGTPSGGAARLAADLLWKLAEPYDIGDQETTLTASIGIASYPDNGLDFEQLLKSAKIAMNNAQANGRGTFAFFSAAMYEHVMAHDAMTKALRHAIARNQMELVYQPQVDLQTGQICGVEALLRWQHPELGAISPMQFIPLAEESGLIIGIGEWVLRRACQDIRRWLDHGIKVPHVAINASPLQFRDNNLVTQVKAALSESKIDPALIYIEVTESALMDDVPRNEATLNALKDLGIKLSLDDFGTGYSSLSYLKRFPFDQVKIDQSFVRDIATSQSDSLLVKVIVSMAHGLGMKVIAEGVETEAQCEIMRTSICDEIQGYFFSRPISAQAIEEILSEGRQLPAHLLRLQKPQRTLLLVDDEPNILASLKRLFRRDGHVILIANSGSEGLELLSKHKVDLIISDQRMPGMTGVEFLRAAKTLYPDTIRIVLSGYTELRSVTDAINEGAVYRFLTKPWEDEPLREHINKAFEYKELLEENRQLDIKIRTTNQELIAANRQLGDVLQNKRHQIERDESILAIAREALQHMPLPVLGVDDEGLIAFANAAAESRFASAGALLGVELGIALPAIDAAISSVAGGVPCELLIEGTRYVLKWNPMGAHSRARGKIVTLIATRLCS